MNSGLAEYVVSNAVHACADKRCFVSRREAATFIKRHHFKTKPYKCPLCDFWHTTSLDKKNARFARRAISTARRTTNS